MRTQYFQNIRPGHNNAVKRITAAGLIEAAMNPDEGSRIGEWGPSAYDTQALNDSTQFKRITRDEARKLRPANFRTARKLLVTKAPPVGLALANTYRKAVEGLDYKRTQKIQAIKEVRTVGYFGLAESLTIVENFDKFLAFLEANNELPNVGSRFDSNPFTKKA